MVGRFNSSVIGWNVDTLREYCLVGNSAIRARPYLPKRNDCEWPNFPRILRLGQALTFIFPKYVLVRSVVRVVFAPGVLMSVNPRRSRCRLRVGLVCLAADVLFLFKLESESRAYNFCYLKRGTYFLGRLNYKIPSTYTDTTIRNSESVTHLAKFVTLDQFAGALRDPKGWVRNVATFIGPAGGAIMIAANSRRSSCICTFL